MAPKHRVIWSLRWRALCLGAITLGAVAADPSPAAVNAPEVIATERASTAVAAYGDLVVWSSFDPATKRYSLMSLAGDRIERLPIRSRAVAFDADLGLGPDGEVTAVYSRCGVEPEPFEEQNFIPDYAAGRDCRLYRFSFEERKERRVRSPRRQGRGEFLPAIWRDRIAFGRVSRRQGAPELVIRSLRSGHERKVRLPVRGAFRDAARTVLTGTDLRGASLASAWLYQEVECRRQERDPEDDKVEPFGTQLFAGAAAHQRTVASACQIEDLKNVSNPDQSSGSIFALVARQGQLRTRRTFSRAGQPTTDSAIPLGTLDFAVGRSSVYFSVVRSVEEAGRQSFAYDIVRTAR
ncbi:MAG TPA: hypothetical protein VF533_11355 [Solirubrobacteraceae bacterium]|jgi:hypothetical protein